MLDRADKLGVAAGLLTAPIVFLLLVEEMLYYCDSQCSPRSERLYLAAALVVSSTIALAVGVLITRAFRWMRR